MAIAQPQLQNRLALVSSLYGPGTITCWYLTTLSVLLSWTLHPRKRNSGSIDVDLIAILTLPAVAAGHLLSQVQGLLNQDNTFRASSSADLKYIQSVAAIEAPLNVSETFMAISVILFILAAWMFCIRRAIFVALIGILCYGAECYIHFSDFMDLGLQYMRPGGGNYPTFSRLFVADFANLVIIILVTLSICGFISAAIAIFMLFLQWMPSSRLQQDTERFNEAAPRDRMPVRFRTRAVDVTRSAETTHETRQPRRFEGFGVRSITVVTTVFLPVSFVSSLLPSFWHSTNYHTATSTTASFWQTLKQYASRFIRDFYPRTACSFTDLDQVVAATAGATVLGFSIYSIAKAHYKRWNVSRPISPEPTDTELGRFENRPAS